MEVKIANLTAKGLRDLPDICKYCVYWEFPEERYQRNEERFKKKLKWLKKVNKEFGNCGKIVYINEKPVAYAQYAPREFLPNSFNYPSLPSEDAVLISCLFIFTQDFRGLGIGTKLLKSG